MQKHSRLTWSDEAREHFKKVPPFVRPMAKKSVEQFARRHGHTVITPEIISRAKGNNDNHPAGEKGRKATNLGKLDRQTSRLHEPNQDWFAREGVDPLRYAFAEKAAVHAGAGGEHLPSDEVSETWNRLAMLPDNNPRRTVYVHIPFCRSRCRFCGFYMYGKNECDSNEYTDALLAEMEQAARQAAVAEQVIHAVYLGGGTPSDLEAVDLCRLVAGIRTILPLANDCEITVEGRVAGFSVDKITACLDGGANRFSIGVQSFSTEIRRKMGRISDREQVLAMLDNLAGNNNAATVIDLIYGFPGQTMDIWQEDVRTFLEETALDGCDMYQLNVFRGGPLATAIEEGRLEPAADIPVQADMFALGRRMAMRERMKRLSMNHWAWNERERNRYNSFTRFGATCIPFGCGAGGRLQGHYFFQEGNLKQYYKFVANREKPIATAMRLSRWRPFFRDLVGSMEEGAVNLHRLARDHGVDAPGLFAPLLEQWQRVGLITLDGDGWLELTEAGEFWNVTLAQKLIDYFNWLPEKKREKVAV
jgi:oxygen-independent coproporphyrinogen-3 oxidase